MKKEVTSAFNKLAYDYEHTVDKNSVYNTDYERPAMIKLLPEQLEHNNVLDAGCAAGWYTEYLLNAGAAVSAIDLSPKMVEATKRRVGNKANVICHDLSEPLPFADESFDIIISSLTLHYLKDWLPTFEQFKRVLKPGGMLLYSVQHPFMDFTFFKRENYFSTELLRDTWNKSSGEIDVVFYRRPMHNIVSETARFFHIQQMIEPQPADSLLVKEPKHYHYLMTNPHFLIMVARKVKES